MKQQWPRLTFSVRGSTLQLAALTVLPLTVLLLVIAFSGLYAHQQAMRTLVGERDERAVQAASRALEAELNHRSAAITSLARQASGQNRETILQIIANNQALLNDFDAGLAFFNPDGTLITYTGQPAFWEYLAAGKEPAFERIISLKSSVNFSDLITNPANNQPVILSTAPGTLKDILAAGALSPELLARQTLDGMFASGPQVTVLLIDKTGELLYRSGSLSPSTDFLQHPGIPEALRGETGTLYRQIDENEHVVAYSPVNPLGWGLILEESWEEVSSPMLRTTLLAPLVLVPALLVAALAAWYGARQIIQPLQDLENRSAQLAWGDFTALDEPVGGIVEIQALQNELIEMARKVQAAQKGLHGYIGAITKGQEEERRRLARELHDDTIQSLIALKQRIQLTRMGLKSETTVNTLAELETLAEETIDELRRVTRALRPIYLEDLGLVTALEMLARESSQSTGVSIHFNSTGEERRLKPEEELALYRIAQEAVSNVLRHAQARQANLQITFNAKEIILSISDNGMGFEVPKSPTEFAHSGHFGLLGVYERAELIGAQLEIHSTSGKGTNLRVVLPRALE